MSISISSKIIPPAILNAGIVIPRMSKINVPTNANPVNRQKQVIEARLAIDFRCSSVDEAVIARNVGTRANGSTRKKMEESVTRKNWIA